MLGGHRDGMPKRHWSSLSMRIRAKWTVLVACLICSAAQAEPRLADPQAYASCLYAFGPVFGVLCRKNPPHEDRNAARAEVAGPLLIATAGSESLEPVPGRPSEARPR
jgi:hypothetical protein